MANLSKLSELTLPYNCYEIGHTWSPFCSEAALIIGLHCFQESLKIYGPLYFVSQLFNKKYSLEAFIKTFQSVLTSSCFLSFNAFSYMVIFCFIRKVMGKFHFLHCSYLPAFLASLLAILIERENRRGALALYVTNVASETFFRMAVSRGKITPLPHGEVALFSGTMALLLYILRRYGLSKDLISLLIRYLLGSSEFSSPSNIQSSSNQTTFFCPHPDKCLNYVGMGFLQPFLVGFGVQSLLRLRAIIRNKLVLSSLLPSLRFGLFLGSFGALFKGVSCLLRRRGEHNDCWVAIPAGLVAGLSLFLYPSPSIALYLLWKLIELAYNLGMKEGYLPYIEGSIPVLYAASTAVLFYAAILEPHNLKPAYFKFLNRITDNKIGKLNRHALDIFGTHASQLYKDYIPAVDIKYTSNAYKEGFLIWLIQ